MIDDCGLKYNIMRILQAHGCEVVAVPAGTSAEQVLDLEPDGVVMSPGPGDPELLDYAVETARGLAGRVPMLGICLGNQVIARAFGGRNYKLKFGHRGGNHPVRDNRTGLVHITAQNHGYAVDPDSLPTDLEVSHVNLNDGTVEGLRHRSLPVNEHPVPLGGVAWPARQRVHLHRVPWNGSWSQGVGTRWSSASRSDVA